MGASHPSCVAGEQAGKGEREKGRKGEGETTVFRNDCPIITPLLLGGIVVRPSRPHSRSPDVPPPENCSDTCRVRRRCRSSHCLTLAAAVRQNHQGQSM